MASFVSFITPESARGEREGGRERRGVEKAREIELSLIVIDVVFVEDIAQFM